MNNNLSMVEWCSSWVLVGGSLACMSGLKWQLLSEPHERFLHDLSCRAKDELTQSVGTRQPSPVDYVSLLPIHTFQNA
jgi:hypothetical protein